MRSRWFSLARQDMASSYRRTFLGPFWISVQQIAFIFGIGVLYSQLFKVDAHDHIPLVAYGILLFGLCTRLVTGAGDVYVGGGSSVRSSTLPISFYIFHSVAREFITFLHIALVTAFVPVIYGRTPTGIAVVAVPLGIALVLLNGIALGLWLGPMSARFRDIHVGLAALLQLMLFVTPVFWDAETLGRNHWAIVFNPFAWAILSIRDPLLGRGLDMSLLISFVVFTVVNLCVGFVAFSRSRLWISYLS
jgi:ABC-type polysaccharide/polyol phosphate export permease